MIDKKIQKRDDTYSVLSFANSCHFELVWTLAFCHLTFDLIVDLL